MKFNKILLILLLLICLKSKSQTADNLNHSALDIKIRSYEIMSQNGEVNFLISIKATDSVYLDSIHTNSTYFITSSNNAIFPIFLDSSDSIEIEMTLTYDNLHLPFSYKNVSNKIFSHNSKSIEHIDLVSCNVYFTAYGTTEVWNMADFSDLNRVWGIYDSIEPERVFIPKDSIVTSNIEYPVDTLDLDWKENYFLKFYSGLPYAIEMKAINPDSITKIMFIDTFNSFDSLGNELAVSFTVLKHFQGNVEGMLKSDYINDMNNIVIGGIALGGIRVKLKSKGTSLTLSQGYTNDNGYFNLSYDVYSWLDGQQIELYLEFSAKSDNDKFGFKVKGKHKTGAYYSILEIPSQGKVGYFNSGTIILKQSLSYPFRIANWVYRGYRFFENVAPSFIPNKNLVIKLYAQGSDFESNGRVINLEEGHERHESIIWHEYGHYVMYSLFGEVNRLDGQAVPKHYFEKEANYQCAWSEGWATGLACMLDVYFNEIDNESGVIGWAEGIGSLDLESRDRDLLNNGIVSNGLRSEYYIACLINDLFDGSDYSLIPSNYNDETSTTLLGGTGFDLGIIDDVSLSAEDIFFCMTSASHGIPLSVSDYYINLLTKFEGDCDLKKRIKKIFDQNGIKPVSPSILPSDALSSDLIGLPNTLFDSGNGHEFNTSFNIDRNLIDVNGSNDNSFNVAAGLLTSGEQLSDNLLISNDGYLFVNRDSENGWANLTGSFSSFPISTMNLEVCADKIKITNNGTLQIGDPNGDNKAIVTLDNSSIIEMNSNNSIQPSTNIINDNSKLIIAEGAILKFYPNSTIILNGPNAILEVNGQIQVMDGATFTFTGGSDGLGYVKFFKNVASNTPNLINSPTGDGSIYFNGTNRTTRLIEIDGSEGLLIGNDIADFHIGSAEILMGEQSMLKLDVHGEISALLVDVRQLYSGYLHRGIYVGGAINQFVNTAVYGGTRGFTNYFAQGRNNNLKLRGVLIEDCDFGIYSYGGGINYYGGHIYGYSKAAWKALGLSKPCILSNVTIENTNRTSSLNGVDIEGNGSFALTSMYESSIGYNQIGALVNFSDLLLNHCNTFTKNNVGVQMETYTKLDMSNESFTNFDDNSGTQIVTRYHGSLFMNNGSNGFVNQTTVQPLFACLEPSTISSQISGTSYLSNGNYFEGALKAAPLSGSNYFINQRGTGLYYDLGGINITYPNKTSWTTAFAGNCALVPNDGNTSETGQGQRLVQTVYTSLNSVNVNCSPYSSVAIVTACVPLIDSLYRSLSPDLIDIVTNLSPIVNCSYSNHTPIMHQLQKKLFNDLQVAYALGVARGQISVDTSSLDYITNTVLDVFDGLLDKANDTIGPWDSLKFELTTAKAEVYRLAEHRDEAIDILTDALYEFTDSMQQIILYRNICINEAEKAYLNFEVTLDSMYYLYPCFNNVESVSLSRPSKNKDVNINNLSRILKIYPNPASTKLTLDISNKDVIKKILIYDIRGILVQSIDVNSGESLYTLSTDSLSLGNYVIQVVTTNNVFNKTFSVLR